MCRTKGIIVSKIPFIHNSNNYKIELNTKYLIYELYISCK